ncbi:MAG: Glycosyltransferase, partial [Candidatus Roizmanbacteria bacterium GW2011_GWA2_37_7]
ERYVDDYPSMNLLVKKKVFLDLGGFDNDFWPGEDSKLCEDLVYKKNGKILYHPDVLIYHHRRDSLFGFLRQHSQYGYHRGAFFAHGDKNSRRFSYLMPTILVILVLYLFAIAILQILFPPFFRVIFFPFLTFPLKLYFISVAIQGILFFVNTQNIMISALAVVALVLMHITYGLFFIKGFFIGWYKKEKIY